VCVSASDSATGTPFAKVGIPLTPMLAYPLAEFDKSYFNQHALVRVVDATDFRPSRSGDGTVPVAAHSLRECRRAMARRGRPFVRLG
jgi:hypothetical protein